EQKTIFRPSGILRSKFLYFALKIRYRHPEKAKGLCISDFSLMQQPLCCCAEGGKCIATSFFITDLFCFYLWQI
ncbi:MAG: hypothetical protein PUB49_06390, partial [Selenomonadaceae bacterium]|nr:hypothetical protein [Selenomonadaceae bacterium]